MSQHSGSVSLLSEHPASPALLTSHGPHRSHCSTTLLRREASLSSKLQREPRLLVCVVAPCRANHGGFPGNEGPAHGISSTIAGPIRTRVAGREDAADRTARERKKGGARRLLSLSARSALSFSLRAGETTPPLRPWNATLSATAASHRTTWDEHAQKTGRTAVTQPPVVAKKRAWVVRTHSQFEDRLRSWAPQGWPLMRCFTGCNQ